MGFHFNKPFSPRNCCGRQSRRQAVAAVQQFLCRLHGLWCPSLGEAPQYLTPELHGWAGTSVAIQRAGLCLGYNSTGARARSTLHFQSFVQTTPYDTGCCFSHMAVSSLSAALPGFTMRARMDSIDELHQRSSLQPIYRRRGFISSLAYRRTAIHSARRTAAMAGAKWLAPSPCLIEKHLKTPRLDYWQLNWLVSRYKAFILTNPGLQFVSTGAPMSAF